MGKNNFKYGALEPWKFKVKSFIYQLKTIKWKSLLYIKISKRFPLTYNFQKFCHMSTKKCWSRPYGRHLFKFHTSFGKFICLATFVSSFVSFRYVLKILDRGCSFYPPFPQRPWRSPSKIGLKKYMLVATLVIIYLHHKPHFLRYPKATCYCVGYFLF